MEPIDLVQETRGWKALGLFMFFFCLTVSFSMAFNFYVNLATVNYEVAITAIVAIIQEGIKAYALVKGFSWYDLGKRIKNDFIIKKARIYFFAYAVTLAASLFSGVGTGVEIVDKRSQISMGTSYNLDIDFQNKRLKVEEGKLSVIQDKIDTKIKQRNILDTDTTTDPIVLKKQKDLLAKDIDILNKQKDAENTSITTINSQILDLQKRDLDNVKQTKADMFTLLARLFKWKSTTPIAIVSFTLVVTIVEAGLFITAPHPKLTQSPLPIRQMGRPRGSKNRPKEEIEELILEGEEVESNSEVGNIIQNNPPNATTPQPLFPNAKSVEQYPQRPKGVES